VCHQGFFVPYDKLAETSRTVDLPEHWVEYRPCNFRDWCNATNGFDCAQKDLSFTLVIPAHGEKLR
jgi:hypothetical protein